MSPSVIYIFAKTTSLILSTYMFTIWIKTILLWPKKKYRKNAFKERKTTGDTRLVQDSDVISSGIKELWLLKSHWLVSAVINYERQTGWCSQMKQNMFGCAAQPSNDAGKQKDNCPLRWLEKSFSESRTAGFSSQQQSSTFKARTAANVCTCIHSYWHTRAHTNLPVKSLLTGREWLGNWW